LLKLKEDGIKYSGLPKERIMRAVMKVFKKDARKVFKVVKKTKKLKRDRELSEPRAYYFYFCKLYSEDTLKQIGLIKLGDDVIHAFDHSTVLYHFKTISGLSEVDAKTRDRIEEIKKHLWKPQ
jgi:chromosomal replication initiation ATPase DnaA